MGLSHNPYVWDPAIDPGAGMVRLVPGLVLVALLTITSMEALKQRLGDAAWQRTVTGAASLERIEALSISFDSWGGDPFTIWLDGLAVD